MSFSNIGRAGELRKQKKSSLDEIYGVSNEETVFQCREFISIEAWVAEKDPYRVVALRDRIASLLARHQIEYNNSGLDRRIDWDVTDDSSVKLDTFFVETSNEDPRAFKVAAIEIFRLFQEAGKQADTIEVEICNSSLTMAADHSFPVLDDPIVNAVDNARSTILEVVDRFCGTAWTSIAYHMRGK
ncbi:hypothetical protein MMC27_005622 [Xylographa pallens]|nr:hypothetical protein [Xylographa pallens]